MTTNPAVTDVTEAQEAILRSLRDADAPLPLTFFDDVLDRRLFTVALNRLARAGVVDIHNGHVVPSKPRLVRKLGETEPESALAQAPTTVPVPVDVLERLTAALDRVEHTPTPSPEPAVTAPPKLAAVPDLPAEPELPSLDVVAQQICIALRIHGPMPKARIRNNYLSNRTHKKMFAVAAQHAIEAGAITISYAPKTLHLGDVTTIGMSWEELDEASEERRARTRMNSARAQAREEEGREYAAWLATLPRQVVQTSLTSLTLPQPEPVDTEEDEDEESAAELALRCVRAYLIEHGEGTTSWLCNHALPTQLQPFIRTALSIGRCQGLILADGPPELERTTYRLNRAAAALSVTPVSAASIPETPSRSTPAVRRYPMRHPVRRRPVTATGTHAKTMARIGAAVLKLLESGDILTEAQMRRQLPKPDRPWVARVLLMLRELDEVHQVAQNHWSAARSNQNKSDIQERIDR